MSELFIGAVLERAPSNRYYELLRFTEIAPRHPLPRPKVFSGFRSAAPSEAHFTLLAPPDTWKHTSGPFREDPRQSAGAEWLARTHDALAADAIVLVTGPTLSPSARDREHFVRWATWLKDTNRRRVVWQPGGVWDFEDAADFARKIGVVCAFDPLEEEPPPGEIAYARVRAIGTRSRLGEGLLTSILDTMTEADADTVYLAIEADDAIKKARRAVQLNRNLVEGGGAVLRRTGTTSLEDLEDEDDDFEDEDEDEDLEDDDDFEDEDEG